MRAPLALGLAALLLAPRSLQAQASPEEQARRLLEEGRTYQQQGKTKQALDDFNTIVSGFPNTASVDDALLEIGRYYAETESDPAKAREYYEQVTKRYAQSDGAPAAYYQLGLLALQGAGTPAELDEALAQFTRVVRLYGHSDRVPHALYGTGLVQRRAGRLAEALQSQRRVTLEYPGSDIAPAAQFEAGQLLALLGEPLSAMEEFQRVRNAWPQSPWAAQALDSVTALYRLYAGARPAFVLDAGYNLAGGEALKDVRALLVEPGRALWVASDKINGVVPFGPDGRMGASLSSPDLRSLSWTPRNELLVVSRLAVRVGPRDVRTFSIPGDKPGVPVPLEHLTSAVAPPGGGLLVADDKEKKVFRFDARYQYVGPFPDPRPREIARLALTSEGEVVMLDRDARTVSLFDRAGALLKTIGPTGAGYAFRRPVDVAVDAFRNLYVADEEAGVLVISAAGQYLATLSGEELRRPRAVALDPAGAVFVYDDKSSKVVRFR